MTASVPLAWCVLLGVAGPAGLFLILGTTSLLGRTIPEKGITGLTVAAMIVSTVSLAAGLIAYGLGSEPRLLAFGEWSTTHRAGIAVEFLVDRLSLAFAVLSTSVSGIVSAFSTRYLHREVGYQRYFTLLAMFVTGMLLVALAGNIEILFVGWEFVGLSSALLVGFFHERPAPVANAFHVLSVYRISDAAMLCAAVLLRHLAGGDSLTWLFGQHGEASAGLTGAAATTMAVPLIIAVAGKSALLPFSNWLPRAMEGPTPSSAVYYGSLSIHAGCFLLLRSGPLLEHAPAARILAGLIGAATALFAGVTTRVQSDVKSSLAYAALTQVGLIVLEIALGWYTLAFLHLTGHACLRLLQFLSAPNVLHDLHGIENALGERPARRGGLVEILVPPRLRHVLYLVAMERGFLDDGLDRLVVGPFTRLASALTRLDQRLCAAVMPRRGDTAFLEAEDRDD